MPRYIDAEKIEWHEQLEPLGNGKYEYCRVAYMDDIDDIPSADVRENVRGEWMHDKDDALVSGYCSCCGWTTIYTETEIAYMQFCPSCGADMRN